MLTTSGRSGNKFVTVRNTVLFVRETKLNGLVRDLKGTNRWLILQAKNTGASMSVCSTTVSGNVLSAMEFWGFLCTCYNSAPLNLHIHCNGCVTTFGLTHVLSCRTGGLVIMCHNKILDKLLYLSQPTFTPVSVRTGTLIQQVHNRS